MQGWQTAGEGEQAWPGYAYNIKVLRYQEMEIARRAEQTYEQFVARWETRPKEKVRGRSKPAGL